MTHLKGSVLLLALLMFACEPNEDIRVLDADQEKELKLDGLDVQFGENLFNTTIPGENFQEKKEKLIAFLHEGINDIHNMNNTELEIVWDIVLTDTEIYLSTDVKPLIETANASWGCPEGQTLYATCITRSCASDKVNDLGDHMQSGDVISMHHRGLSLKICASSDLVVRAEQ